MKRLDTQTADLLAGVTQTADSINTHTSMEAISITTFLKPD